MHISKEKHALLYKGISDPIVELRLEIINGNVMTDQFDSMLFKLEIEIYRRVCAELNLTR